MGELEHAAFWFWAVVIAYASWCGGTLAYARSAHKRIDALVQELETERANNVILKSRLNELEKPFYRIGRAN